MQAQLCSLRLGRLPVEPPPRSRTFSAVAYGRHYVWRGYGSGEGSNIIAVYDPSNELWNLLPTTGRLPPGECGGRSVCVGRCLYTFGGREGWSSFFNNMNKLNLDTLQWAKLQTSGSQPMKKGGCDLVRVNERTLCCFGGVGIEGTTQPGSTFTKIGNSGGHGMTNEFHFFDIQNGVWSSPKLRGERLPPCSGFTFTMVDQHRAVLFGGCHPGLVTVNIVYLFDFRTMEVTKVEPVQGEPCPVGRSVHATCCLNYGQDHPQLLVHGGYGNDGKTLGDMWILDVNTWTEVTLPESMIPRLFHSITATSLGPGLTEVIIFGGLQMFGGNPIAETTILRFELIRPSASVAGRSAGKWALVDLAHNDTRGTAQRLSEKRIRQATARASSVSETSNHSSQDRVRALEQQLRATQLLLQVKDRELAIKDRELANLDLQETLPGLSTQPALQRLMDKYQLSASLINREIQQEDFTFLAVHFDNVEYYVDALGLSSGEQTDVIKKADTHAAMIKCLKIWKSKKLSRATFRALLDMLLELKKVAIAANVCQYLKRAVRRYT